MEDEVIYGNQNDPQPPLNNQTAKQDILSYAQNQQRTPSNQPQGQNQQNPPPPKPPNSSKSKLKKILIIIVGFVVVLFLILLTVLTIFSGDKSPIANEDVELTYWGMWEDISVPAAIISDFESENPNIKIKYEYQDPAEYKEKLIARYNNGKSPDMFRFHVNWQEDLDNILLPLTTQAVTKEYFEKNYYSVAQKDLIRNGAIYGIPLEIDTLALYINPTIIQQVENENEIEIKLPTNWQEFIEVSGQLTRKDDLGRITIGGVGMGTYDNVNSSPDIISLLFAQNIVDFDDFSQNPARIADALRFYTNFALVEDNVWAQNIDSDLTMFSQGKLAMYFGYSRDYDVIKKVNPGLNFQVIPAPQLTSEKKFTIANYLAEGVSNSSLYQKEAMLFMNYLTRPQVQEKLFKEESRQKSFGAPFSNKNLASKLQGTDVYVFVNQASDALSSPFALSPIPNSKNEGMNAVLGTAINSILTGTNPDEAVENLLQSLNQGSTTQLPGEEEIGEIIDGGVLPQ